MEQLPSPDRLLIHLFEWGNIDRIHNTRRSSTPEEFVKRDYLYQLTSAGARVHREMMRIDRDMNDNGALQSSMLPEVLSSLALMVRELNTPAPDLTVVLGAFQSTTKGFSLLSENAKLFVQGLNGSLASEEIRDVENFIEYKDVVVRYLQQFTVVLEQTSPQIAALVTQAEEIGLHLRLDQLAALEAAPVLGRSRDNAVAREAQRMREQWAGLRRWFVPNPDRPTIAQLLLDRAAEAINFIILTIGHINDQRFRRANRTADLVTLAGWFDHASVGPEATSLWRTAFGSYPSRHLGNPREAEDDDPLVEESWWESAPAPVSAELRARGPRAGSGPVPRIRDPRRAKSLLAAQQRREESTVQNAEEALAARGPVRLSALGALEPAEAEVFLTCLGLALAARTDRRDVRRARTPDGRLQIVLSPAADKQAGAGIHLRGGRLSLSDFELAVSMIGRRQP
ncbi:TIGR02677 family protein [Kitasatospora purpeofusca]|uniref:TIGR02677 family protein n=1 Tax=Kitasatospora purpeofusca TaxID=67352 RepID=UPI002E154966|nr:TIGR02677 family protein [Kitasatospora purpeofusca]